MNNLPMPKIDSDFRIEDIHRIREWHYQRRKNMTPQEICEDTRKGAKRFIALLSTPIEPSIQEEVNRRLRSVRKDKSFADV